LLIEGEAAFHQLRNIIDRIMGRNVDLDDDIARLFEEEGKDNPA
jgi:hypothetical protein